MKILVWVIILGLAGLGAGYFLFGKIAGQYVSLSALVFGANNLLEQVGQSLAGLGAMRQKILIAGGIGAGIGLVIGISSGGRRR